MKGRSANKLKGQSGFGQIPHSAGGPVPLTVGSMFWPFNDAILVCSFVSCQKRRIIFTWFDLSLEYVGRIFCSSNRVLAARRSQWIGKNCPSFRESGKIMKIYANDIHHETNGFSGWASLKKIVFAPPAPGRFSVLVSPPALSRAKTFLLSRVRMRS